MNFNEWYAIGYMIRQNVKHVKCYNIDYKQNGIKRYAQKDEYEERRIKNQLTISEYVTI